MPRRCFAIGKTLPVADGKGNDFIRLHDTAGRSIYCSPSVDRLYGQVPATIFEFVHLDDAEACRRWWERVLAGSEELLYWRVRNRARSLAVAQVAGVDRALPGEAACHDRLSRCDRAEGGARRAGPQRPTLAAGFDALPVGVAVVNLSGDVIARATPHPNAIWAGMIATGSARYARSKGWWHRHGQADRTGRMGFQCAAFTSGQASVNGAHRH